MSSFTSTPLPNTQNLVLPNPGVNPYRNQMVFSQMCGAVQSCNPDADISDIQVEINSIVRQIYDRRQWSGLFVRGQIATTGFTIGGTVQVTQGSQAIQGTGTAWTPAIIGQQFRMGTYAPPYNITGLDETAQILTIEMPWASPSVSTAGYWISQYWYALGPNIKYVHVAVNMLMGWRLRLDYTQQTLDARDPWRFSVLTPYALAQMPPDQNGNYMVELWPLPAIVQSLPFIAAVQPPNLVNDNDALPPAIRADVVVKLGQAWAKTYKGPKWNKYYDAGEAGRLRADAERELLWMARADEDLYRQNLLYPGDSMRMAPDLLGDGRNSIWDVNHAVEAQVNTGLDW